MKKNNLIKRFLFYKINLPKIHPKIKSILKVTAIIIGFYFVHLLSSLWGYIFGYTKGASDTNLLAARDLVNVMNKKCFYINYKNSINWNIYLQLYSAAAFSFFHTNKIFLGPTLIIDKFNIIGIRRKDYDANLKYFIMIKQYLNSISILDKSGKKYPLKSHLSDRIIQNYYKQILYCTKE